jgi:hypothetical protein
MRDSVGLSVIAAFIGQNPWQKLSNPSNQRVITRIAKTGVSTGWRTCDAALRRCLLETTCEGRFSALVAAASTGWRTCESALRR